MNKAKKNQPRPLAKQPPVATPQSTKGNYGGALRDISTLLESARLAASRSVNALMTATYWLVGERIVQVEQGGKSKAGYGETLLARFSADLTARFGRGFSVDNLETMRRFYLAYPLISETPSRKLGSAKSEALSRVLGVQEVAVRFPLPWSHYVLLVRRVEDPKARSFYEEEALLGGWAVRQMDRQIASQFYERTALSKNKAAMLSKGSAPQSGEREAPESAIKEPFILEFLGLKDEYSESDLEEALIQKLEEFLLELGGDFAFIGRQRRLRVGSEWYRVDLLFFHRRLKCLVVIDLKVGKFTHADAGQMHLYLNYAREHWMQEGEHPPVGLILCAQKDAAVAHYALEGLPNKVMAAEYKLALPAEKTLTREIEKARRVIEGRCEIHGTSSVRCEGIVERKK